MLYIGFSYLNLPVTHLLVQSNVLISAYFLWSHYTQPTLSTILIVIFFYSQYPSGAKFSFLLQSPLPLTFLFTHTPSPQSRIYLFLICFSLKLFVLQVWWVFLLRWMVLWKDILSFMSKETHTGTPWQRESFPSSSRAKKSHYHELFLLLSSQLVVPSIHLPEIVSFNIIES